MYHTLESLTHVQRIQALAFLDKAIQLLQLAQRRLGKKGVSVFIRLDTFLGNNMLQLIAERLYVLWAANEIKKSLQCCQNIVACSLEA